MVFAVGGIDVTELKADFVFYSTFEMVSFWAFLMTASQIGSQLLAKRTADWLDALGFFSDVFQEEPSNPFLALAFCCQQRTKKLENNNFSWKSGSIDSQPDAYQTEIVDGDILSRQEFSEIQFVVFRRVTH